MIREKAVTLHRGKKKTKKMHFEPFFFQKSLHI
jgi:hypothetical protein